MFKLAHRGYSAYYPENTMSAFEKALHARFDGIETDVQMTHDGVLVLLHDERINRTSTGKGLLKEMDYEKLKRYNFNYKFKMRAALPRLDELFSLMQHNHKILNLEIKGDTLPGTEEKVVEMVRAYHLEKRIYFSSASLDSITKIKELMPESYGALIVGSRYKQGKQDVIENHLDGIHCRASLLNAREIAFFKEKGIKVGAWTVKKRKNYLFFKEQDIFFIFTNRYFR